MFCLHRHHTNLSKHIMLGSQLSRKDPHSPQHVGVLSHQEGRCGIPPDKPTPQNRGILIQAGRGLAHTAHSRCSADFDQLITAKVSYDQPYPNSGSAQTSPSRGVLAQRPLDSSCCSWKEPWGCTRTGWRRRPLCRRCGPGTQTRQAAPSHPVAAVTPPPHTHTGERSLKNREQGSLEAEQGCRRNPTTTAHYSHENISAAEGSQP